MVHPEFLGVTMPSRSHLDAQRRAAGKHGYTEVPLPSGRRLDALTASGHRATEVERSGRGSRIVAAISRLIESGSKQRVLRVPEWDLHYAADIMVALGVTGTVKNLRGTKSISVY